LTGSKQLVTSGHSEDHFRSGRSNSGERRELSGSKQLVTSGHSQQPESLQIQANAASDKWSDGCTCLQSTRTSEPARERGANQSIPGPELTNGGASDQMQSVGSPGTSLNSGHKLQSADSFRNKALFAEDNSLIENEDETNRMDNRDDFVKEAQDQASLIQEMITEMGEDGAKDGEIEIGMDDKDTRRLENGAGTDDCKTTSTTHLHDHPRQQRRITPKIVS
jgi:hypothetical protein